ncbi:MAG TPA: hypothetical protein VGQ03_02925 [Nitrososphaera sp.]|jgi:hypothetical protein|nr:hypothetical protein [Nitrososphaera sp.]
MSKTALKNKMPDPRLSTIQMIETAIKKAGSYPSKNKLRLSLPRQIQYSYFNQTLKYLEESNKIMYDKYGAIVWIFADKPKLRKLLSTSTRLA